jgi:hypothetical protein
MVIMEFKYSPIERNRYFYGKLLTVRDFNTEQDYNELKRRLLNRLVVGAGVVCGLGVSASDDATLTVESGMALDYLGREIVVDKALIRRLEMLEGYGELAGHDDAYLCLGYDESQEEPVNAAGSSSDSRECNRVRETYRLWLSPDPPDYAALLKAQGAGNVSVLYASEELTIVLCTPEAVQAGGSAELTALVVKSDKTLPVRFTLEWDNGFIDNGGGRIVTEYTQAANSARNVAEVKFKYTVRDMSDMAAQFFPSGVELNVEIGSRAYKNFLQPDVGVYVCGTPERYEEYVRISDSLDDHASGGDMPIYLAKLELVGISNRIFLGAVTDLPFGQYLRRGERGGDDGDGGALTDVTTSVKTLEYWQSPAVRAISDGGSLHLEFSLPKPENYDYRTSHGYVDVAMPGGIKVNSKYYSDEIAHGLGPGNVNVRLAIEFMGGSGAAAMIFGNADVFRAKNSEVNPPWAEAAAVIYPERGTMRVGVWTHDTVEGNSLRVHYFADKPDRDTRPLIDEPQMSVAITPEIARVGRREKLQLEANVGGGADKAVIWSVKGDGCGSVDENGVYQAPESRGTYEVTARCRADENVAASAFIIVE